ncbi:FHA domain-containing protein [bacterium]|nr:FHA domain-containing protein [bacterium]
MWKLDLQLRVRGGAATGRVYRLEAPNLSIGRTSQGVARTTEFIHLDDDTVSRLHADLRWDDSRQKYMLINRSATNPTSVNDVLVDQVELHPGDQIRMGECVCHLEPAEAGEPAQPAYPIAAVTAEETKKLKGPISLTSRPPLFVQVIAGPNGGQKVAITGIVAALGGPTNPQNPPPVGTARWFDQEITLADDALPAHFLSLTWRELLSGFELARTAPHHAEVKVHRNRGGLVWVGLLSAAGPGIVRANDIVSVGSHQFQVVVG